MSPVTTRRGRAALAVALTGAALVAPGPAHAAPAEPVAARAPAAVAVSRGHAPPTPAVAISSIPQVAGSPRVGAIPRSRTGIVTHWWGWEIRLRNRKTNRIISVINAGAGIATLASVLAAAGVISSPGAIPTGIVAAVIALGGRALDLCNWNDRGVRILIARPLIGATCVPR